MGFRLSSKILKIWRWIKRSRKSRSYARLHHQNRRKSVCLRIGRRLCRRSANSRTFSHEYLNSCDSPRESSVSLLRSPPYSEQIRRRQIRRLPGLELESPNFRDWHFNLPHKSRDCKKGLEVSGSKHVPKGYLAVDVGQGEEHHRFVIPVMYFNHPLFGELLKEAEEEYGFDQKGAINIPCDLQDFQNVQRLIHSHRH